MNILRVNLTNATIKNECLPEKYWMLGGRGLTSNIIKDQVPADCDPLGPDNLLVFAPELLCGTQMVNTGRLSIGAKPPLTKGIKEANSGGTMALAMARLGIRAIIFEGKAEQDKLFNLVIDASGNAVLEDAHAFKGMRNYAFVEKLIDIYGSQNAVSSIGPAGEMMLASASIQTTDPDGRPCRAAARGGKFEGASKIDGDALFKKIQQNEGKTTHKGCSKCVIHCSNVYTDSQGRSVTSALEYETIWAMGAMTCIDDLDAIAHLDYLCDDIGLDTMNTGTALAVAMDAGAIAWGDKAAAIKEVESITQGDVLGTLIGEGPDAVANHLNHSRVPTVKGQSIAGYDPRAMPGIGMTYATSPMGADHTAGFVGGATGSTDKLMQMSRSSQIHMAALDSMGLCMFAQSGGIDNVCKALSLIKGIQFGMQEWQALGYSILKAEIEFNQAAGLRAEEDRLPSRFHNERLSPMHDRVPYPEQDLHAMLEPLKG